MGPLLSSERLMKGEATSWGRHIHRHTTRRGLDRLAIPLVDDRV